VPETSHSGQIHPVILNPHFFFDSFCSFLNHLLILALSSNSGLSFVTHDRSHHVAFEADHLGTLDEIASFILTKRPFHLLTHDLRRRLPISHHIGAPSFVRECYLSAKAELKSASFAQCALRVTQMGRKTGMKGRRGISRMRVVISYLGGETIKG